MHDGARVGESHSVSLVLWAVELRLSFDVGELAVGLFDWNRTLRLIASSIGDEEVAVLAIL